MTENRILDDFITVVREKDKGPKPYDTTGTVIRVEGKKAFVRFSGNKQDETPVDMDINAVQGDMVRVRVSGGNAWITGNASAPPTDDRTANAARQVANTANQTALAAQLEAVEAGQAAAYAQVAADNAQASADIAAEAAENAQNSADAAAGAAASAQADATIAKEQAASAVQDAATAKTQAASAVQDAATAKQSAESAVADAATAKTQAASAVADAETAKTQAASAVADAATAKTQAASAVADAATAKEQAASAVADAATAKEQAASAKADASRANKYAGSALDQLGVMQDVVGVLTWASEHGTFTHTSDTAIQDGKVYFVYDSVTQDYTPVIEPDASQLSNYYELTVDEAMDSFINAHLVVTGKGLWVLPSGINTGSVTPESGETMDDARARLGSNYKVLLANTGMTVYDGDGIAVSTYGESIEFNSDRPQRIGGDDVYIEYYDSNNDGRADSLRIVGASVVFSSGETLEHRIAAAATLLYDHTYTITNGVATFTAFLWEGKEDVKTSYEPQQFTWWYKNEENEQEQPLLENLVDGAYVNYGYTISVSLAEMGYGTHIIGKFTKNSDTQLLTEDDDTLTDSQDHPITGRTESGESVRVSDLSVATTLYSNEKLMVVGAEDEHLISVQTLQDYLNANLTKQVLFNTTAGWNTQITLVSDPNTLYIYTDHQVDSQGNKIAGIKAGDGNAYVVDLPFTDAIATEHIADTTRHITPAERAAWNNHMSNDVVHITNAERDAWNEKVRCYYAGTEQLVFTTT